MHYLGYDNYNKRKYDPRLYYLDLELLGEGVRTLEDMQKEYFLENNFGILIDGNLCENQELFSRIFSIVQINGEYINICTENIDIKIKKGGNNKFVIFSVNGQYKLIARNRGDHDYHADIIDNVAKNIYTDIKNISGGYVRCLHNHLDFNNNSEAFGRFDVVILKELLTNEILLNTSENSGIKKEEEFFVEPELDTDFGDLYYEQLSIDKSRVRFLDDIVQETAEIKESTGKIVDELLSVFGLELFERKEKRRGTKGKKHRQRLRYYIDSLLNKEDALKLVTYIFKQNKINLKETNKTIWGKKVYAALCPFHQEKTPSFYYTPANGYFHCFGCQKGGSIIDVIRRFMGKDTDVLKYIEKCLEELGINKKKK